MTSLYSAGDRAAVEDKDRAEAVVASAAESDTASAAAEQAYSGKRAEKYPADPDTPKQEQSAAGF